MLLTTKSRQPLYRARVVQTVIFGVSMEYEQADAGRDGRTHLATPNSQARTGTENFPYSADHDRIDNLTRLIHTLLLLGIQFKEF